MNVEGGVLVLSHVGFSFVEDLIEALRVRQLKVFLLSSLPVPEHQPKRLQDLREKVDVLHSTESHVLTREDLESCMASLQQGGERVLCCITVWEGYRHLMALANSHLGVPDLDESLIHALRNKLALRNRLADASLTSIRATALTRESLETLKQSERRYFIKPVSGIASYGAFSLRPQTQWSELEQIAKHAELDTVYASAFGEGLSFLAEDYLPGREFSFEVIAVDGDAQIVAIHEKCELTEVGGTVLENCCTSPPFTLSERECADGIRWVRDVLLHLDARWGCFHVEARYHESRWDLIEVNPRVGGSLISHSVKAMTGTYGMLDLWLDTLLSHTGDDESARNDFRTRLKAISFTTDGASPVSNATFFRVYFAKQGTIKEIALREQPTTPVVSHILLKAGDTIDSTSREVFLGQLLWKLPLEERAQQLPHLLRTSEEAIEIHYDV
ncbi:ATP-grasp domain-containing protein [Pendulispora rubella]|uniref:ATP-grasp domain-containing protein n=1 Tax=Pendulispora rubella TaxID=2741070 RepID=A0ABZ2KRV0_9BACT